MKPTVTQTAAIVPRRERGAIAIVIALSMAVLLGFVGLALDGGRLYVTKTELQNAADACALAASYELTANPIPISAFTRAQQTGVAIAQANSVGFQRDAIAAGAVTVEYSATLSGGWSTSGTGTSKYVRCRISEAGITPWFMQFVGAGDQTVAASATATLAPSQSNGSCAVPMGLCALGAAPDYGYVPGNWYGIDFETNGPGNSVTNYTGNVRWVDFNPSSLTPGCSGGGAQELACVMQGAGQCALPPPTTANCTTSGSANPSPGCVGQTGQINSMQDAYNSRFGVYKGGSGNPSATTAPPDFTGFSYSTENWTLGRNAYEGASGGLPNYRAASTARTPANNPNGISPCFFNGTGPTGSNCGANPYSASSVGTHTTYGASRRIVVVPILACPSFASGQHAPIRAYACVLMLDPYRTVSNTSRSRLEYIGRADEPGSPCATSGAVGNSSSTGPMVPALVQ